jgi:hypothetical protein
VKAPFNRQTHLSIQSKFFFAFDCFGISKQGFFLFINSSSASEKLTVMMFCVEREEGKMRGNGRRQRY